MKRSHVAHSELHNKIIAFVDNILGNKDFFDSDSDSRSMTDVMTVIIETTIQMKVKMKWKEFEQHNFSLYR